MTQDTIFAQATAPGRAAIAVIRVSGPLAASALDAFRAEAPPPRRAAVRRLRGADGEILDEALVIRFEENASFTGEDLVELHCHGGRAVTRAILGKLAQLPGFRLAEPGEFTRRALEAGRLDLSQVEGLADLIDAQTESQRRQALRIMGGALSRKVDLWRGDLIRARALVEAVIDFADEEVPETVAPEVERLIASVTAGIRDVLAGADAAERIRDGFEVALIGRPNTGKSTLLNALAGRDAAITSDIAGTTRDVIEVHMDLRGLSVCLLDTAGLRDAADPIEALGVARAVERARAADIRVLLRDPEDTEPDPATMKPGDLVVWGKADIAGARDDLSVSGKTGEGLDALIDAICGRLEEMAAGATDATRARHKAALAEALRSLDRAMAEAHAGEDRLDVTAEFLRQATRDLESVVGRVDVEDVLDDIFSTFCLGK